MAIFTKRRLISLASASAVIATMAVAAAPTATLAATCAPTGFVRDGIDLTAARIGGAVTGQLDATGCNIGVYNPTSVSGADIFGANYFGVVVNGVSANVTNSSVHAIGETPFDGTQHGRAILYINGASGTISGNQVYDFQKNGIEVSGQTADGNGLSSVKTTATVVKNVVTGEGPIAYIAQNGIVIRSGAIATVKDNTVRDLFYTGTDEATGLLNYNADSVTVSGNTFIDTEVAIYGTVIRVTNVRGSATILVGPRNVRVDFRTVAQPANTVIGNKLDWRVRVDGRMTLHIKEGFGAHDVYRQYFRAGSGRHVIRVIKNDVLVRTVIVRA